MKAAHVMAGPDRLSTDRARPFVEMELKEVTKNVMMET